MCHTQIYTHEHMNTFTSNKHTHIHQLSQTLIDTFVQMFTFAHSPVYFCPFCLSFTHRAIVTVSYSIDSYNIISSLATVTLSCSPCLFAWTPSATAQLLLFFFLFFPFLCFSTRFLRVLSLCQGKRANEETHRRKHFVQWPIFTRVVIENALFSLYLVSASHTHHELYFIVSLSLARCIEKVWRENKESESSPSLLFSLSLSFSLP